MTYDAGRPGSSPYLPTQTVLNEDWPLRDRNGKHARGIPDQPQPIPVDVRVVLSEDGQQWLAGHAQRWTSTHVYVTGLADDRIRARGVWVLATDVRRHRRSTREQVVRRGS